ncbi:GPI mannosyltransferase 1-like [Uloborus diversus]|uniref:GPI mannosyltransferase 1-like n=1 Tax=Uloborus diversus TaxID=327109 RepID=UPI0024096104|nr:GPI mannosyltransferase 1-like [Uloborus diversus]
MTYLDFLNMDIQVHCGLALLIRIGLILFSNFQDLHFKVKYTDIDYQVFTDAASCLWKGESPFQRHTYRYTPLVAFLLTPNIFWFASFGKLFFSCFDVLTSLLIYKIQKKYNYTTATCKLCAFMWLYNPLTMVISTRGSSEAIMTSLVMLTIYMYQLKSWVLFGLAYGLSVHVKIYPCMHALTFYFFLCDNACDVTGGFEKLKLLFVPNRKRITFGVATLVGFIIPTAISVYFYGETYIQEGFLYHLSRKDIKHNFSPYFYILYLSETMDPKVSSYISYAAFFVQAILILSVSFALCSPKYLAPCLFLQTFIFVTFNKVCTSQYFLWYLCLFPLTFPFLNVRIKYIVSAFVVWSLGQVLWLTPAYYLEFQGVNTFFLIFLSSLIFFLINVCLIAATFKCIVATGESKSKKKE